MPERGIHLGRDLPGNAGAGAPQPRPVRERPWVRRGAGRRASASVTSPKAAFGAYSVGWGIEPYPAESRHAASLTEAVPDLFTDFGRGRGHGHGIKPGGGVELDGHLPLFAQFEDGGLIGFHVARGDGGDVFRPQTEIGEMAFRDEPQFQGLDPTTATHAENKRIYP